MEGKNSKDNSTKSLYSPRSPTFNSISTFHELSHLMHDCLIESENSLKDFQDFNHALHQHTYPSPIIIVYLFRPSKRNSIQNGSQKDLKEVTLRLKQKRQDFQNLDNLLLLFFTRTFDIFCSDLCTLILMLKDYHSSKKLNKTTKDIWLDDLQEYWAPLFMILSFLEINRDSLRKHSFQIFFYQIYKRS